MNEIECKQELEPASGPPFKAIKVTVSRGPVVLWVTRFPDSLSARLYCYAAKRGRWAIGENQKDREVQAK